MVGNLGDEFKGLRDQLSSRQYETVKDKKIRIETKKEMKDRLGYSPDEADAFVLLVELMRRKGAVAGRPAAGVVGNRDDRLLKRAIRYSRIIDPAREYSTEAA